MKNLIFIGSLLILAIPTFGQNLKKEIAKDVCSCSKSKGITQMNKEQATQQLGICLFTSINERVENPTEIFGDDFAGFSREIGALAGMECPEVFLSFAKDYLADEMGWEEQSNLKTPTYSETGEITGIDSKQFATVKLKTGDGSIINLLWLQDFEGSKDLISNTFKGKTYKIQYSLEKIYEPKTKTYINYKVIRNLEQL